MSSNTLIVTVVLAILVAITGVIWWAWLEIGTVEMSVHGYLAMAAGVSVTFLLGIGLMMLVYFSHKRGYDDRAASDLDEY